MKATQLSILLIAIPIFLKAQNPKLKEIKKLYRQNEYITCYRQADNLNNPSAEISLLKALAFYQLPDNYPNKNDTDKPLLHTLELLNKAKDNIQNGKIQDSAFYVNEFKTLQTEIFEKAKNWYNYGRQNKATQYFDALHTTFDNSKTIFVNHYGFDDEYLLSILKKEIKVPKEYYKHYKEKYDILEKYYFSNDKFNEWNNPVYRMANTAKDAEYENQDEKMVFYFLNLVRMNPELFLETFLKTRLHIRYHDDLKLQVPVFDSLVINQFSNNLSFNEFMKLPVHKLYNKDLSKNIIERFVKTTVINKTSSSTQYRYDINYRNFYEYLKNNREDLLNLRNLSNYTITDNDKELILFKLYDKKFTIYKKNYKEETSDHYHQSLFKKLKEMDPRPLIFPNKKLFKLAECWAEEAGQKNLKGHDRVNCPYGYDSECCDYGNKNGLDVVLSLLIDRYVPDLGHRKTLLGYYLEMGVAIRPHKSSFKYNAVLDFYK